MNDTKERTRKRCPKCQKVYDDALDYCLDDGTSLETETFLSETPHQTLIMPNSEVETIISSTPRNFVADSKDTLISIQDLKVHYKTGERSIWNTLFGDILSTVRKPDSRATVDTLAADYVHTTDSAQQINVKAKKESHIVKAVNGVNLEIKRGETLGLVGESGCGKSTLGKAILRLTEPTGGKVIYNGKDLASLSKREMREERKNLQMIFQDPYASLNPRMTVGQIIGEPMKTYNLVKGNLEKQVQELMETVGLNRRFVKRYPHEFSGGQRQRIGIARALALDPEFIVADEPISALDVSIQAQIMNLMNRLQDQKNLTYLFISHDLRAIRHVSDRVAVMYLGKIVELGDSKDVYKDPLHPYSKALISAVPVPDPEIEAKRERIILKGDVPSPINPPSGCPFHTRCAYVIPECKLKIPQLVEIKPKHFAACVRISPERPYIENIHTTRP